MKYGLIGKTLGHSYSPRIHEYLGSKPYELAPMPEEALEDFFAVRDFQGINVTIPYKRTVIPYLDRIEEKARRIGAVNTVVKESDGSLSGYNTDYDGICYALRSVGIDVKGAHAIILGSGGTALTTRAVLSDLGAKAITIVSRSGGSILENKPHWRDLPALSFTDYTSVYDKCADAAVIINTTPEGMYPNAGSSPIDLSRFLHLRGVMDVIYNPQRTAFLLQAESLGIPHVGGLPMLVAQAKYAAEYFLKTKISDRVIAKIADGIEEENANFVLIGMPGSGKSTIGALLSQELGRPLVDLDEEIVKIAGKSIPDIFAEDGESAFRDLESAAAKAVGEQTGRIIATGGGVVLRPENYGYLAQNGVIFRLVRDLTKLPRDGRPLSKSPEALAEMERVRAPYYARFADAVIDNNGAEEDTVMQILKVFEKRR